MQGELQATSGRLEHTCKGPTFAMISRGLHVPQLFSNSLPTDFQKPVSESCLYHKQGKTGQPMFRQMLWKSGQPTQPKKNCDQPDFALVALLCMTRRQKKEMRQQGVGPWSSR